jgi:hypothetical protein
LLKKYKKSESVSKKSKLIAYLALGFLPFFAACGFVYYPDKITLIALNGFLTLATQFSEYFGNCERDAIIQNINHKEYIAEHQFLYEFFMTLSIIVSYGLFIYVGRNPSTEAFKILLIAFTLVNPIRFILLYIQRKVRIKLEYKNNQDSYAFNKEYQDFYVIPDEDKK